MQLYNTLSAEERAIMIDDAGKQRLTLSFYAYAQISNPTQFRNDLFLAWNPLDVLGRIANSYIEVIDYNEQGEIVIPVYPSYLPETKTLDFRRDIKQGSLY